MPLHELDELREQSPQFRDPELGYSYKKWDGEAGVDLKERIARFVADMKKCYPEKRILAVTHAGVIRLVHILYGRREYRERVPIGNASVHEFDL